MLAKAALWVQHSMDLRQNVPLLLARHTRVREERFERNGIQLAPKQLRREESAKEPKGFK
jgi:hypothetical protein